jgi:aspartokinase-like uncharacterized kinase
VVVKVGGSLLDWPLLPGRLSAYLASRRGDRLVLVVGGGRAADLVRDLDRAHGLGEDRAHALALHALDFTAQVLADLVPGLTVASRLEDLRATWDAGRLPVVAPRPFLAQDDCLSSEPLPHTWDVTTDSIAARLAARLGASELVLLKSAAPPPGLDCAMAARLGLVDPTFPATARALARVTYRNLRHPDGAEIVLDTETTYLPPSPRRGRGPG